MRFYLTLYRRWAMVEKLSPSDEILYFYLIFPEAERDRAWEICSKAIQDSSNIKTVISSLESYFSLSSVESLGLSSVDLLGSSSVNLLGSFPF